MMVLNASIAGPLLALVLALFGLQTIAPPLHAFARVMESLSRWDVIWPMLPGAGIGFGCLWYWLILTGRSQGVAWGGACIYGVMIALADVLAWGLILGTLQGNPLFGLLLGLAMLILLPVLLVAMSVFGLVMGVLNGHAAQRWIARRRGP
jgi:hypothetical protein